MRPKTCQELGEREGLREVVICARIESRDPAVDLSPCCEHEHRDEVAVRPETPADLEAVDPGHEDVQDCRVGGRRDPESCEGLLAVARELDLVTLELERTPKRFTDSALVVDDEDLHRRIVRALMSVGWES